MTAAGPCPYSPATLAPGGRAVPIAILALCLNLALVLHAAKTGRGTEARRTAQEILNRLRRAPAHVRKLQAEWGRMAEDVLRRT